MLTSGLWIDRFNRPVDRVVFGSITLLLLGVFARELLDWSPGIERIQSHDFRLNIDATARWLAGGAFYPANQLNGPFYEEGIGILYPPTTLLLFAPFAILPPQISAALCGAFLVSRLLGSSTASDPARSPGRSWRCAWPGRLPP